MHSIGQTITVVLKCAAECIKMQHFEEENTKKNLLGSGIPPPQTPPPSAPPYSSAFGTRTLPPTTFLDTGLAPHAKCHSTGKQHRHWWGPVEVQLAQFSFRKVHLIPHVFRMWYCANYTHSKFSIPQNTLTPFHTWWMENIIFQSTDVPFRPLRTDDRDKRRHICIHQGWKITQPTWHAEKYWCLLLPVFTRCHHQTTNARGGQTGLKVL